jgi:hypothetical protein
MHARLLVATGVLAGLALGGSPSAQGRVGSSPSADPGTPPASSLFIVRWLRDALASESRPTITGVPRFGSTLVVRPGTWSAEPDEFRYLWRRDGVLQPGWTGPRHRVGADDVGTRLSVRVVAVRRGFVPAVAASRRTAPIAHRVPVSRTVTYDIATRGRVRVDLDRFARQVQQTYDDPRGWRGSGIAFRRVPRGGDFTVVLSEARLLPSFSSICTVWWSCRVGRDVVVNETRWLRTSPAWRASGSSLRDYRHMVLNHETGHWLGWGHRTCGTPGRPAPVMQQQSKGLDGCRANPWPTISERLVPPSS